MCCVMRNGNRLDGATPAAVAAHIDRLQTAATVAPSQADRIHALAQRLGDAARMMETGHYAAAPTAATPDLVGLGRSKKSSGRKSTPSTAAKSNKAW